MAEIKAKIHPNKMNTSLSTKQVHVNWGGSGTVAITDHSKLINLDYEHSGHTGFAGILYGTTAYWNAQIDYRPPMNMLIVYTDYKQYQDEHGNIVTVPGFKVGDGNAYLIDKPFIGEAESKELEAHMNDMGMHVSEEDRLRWDNKLNYNEPEGDLLEFTRD